jgi:hypothetical protein
MTGCSVHSLPVSSEEGRKRGKETVTTLKCYVVTV